MKKRILTLTICMILTASSAFANSNTTAPAMKLTTQQADKATPNCQCNASGNTLPTQEQMRQNFEEKMTKHREALYSKLCLTSEQKAKAIELDKKARTEAKPLIDKVQEERTKLNDLKTKNACPVAILEQKQKLKDARKALRKHFKDSEKSFEAILTKEQLVKFKAIKEERKAKFKKHCKCHKHPQKLETPAVK